MPVVDQERMGLYIVDLDNQIVEQFINEDLYIWLWESRNEKSSSFHVSGTPGKHQ